MVCSPLSRHEEERDNEKSCMPSPGLSLAGPDGSRRCLAGRSGRGENRSADLLVRSGGAGGLLSGSGHWAVQKIWSRRRDPLRWPPGQRHAVAVVEAGRCDHRLRSATAGRHSARLPGKGHCRRPGAKRKRDARGCSVAAEQGRRSAPFQRNAHFRLWSRCR